MANHNCQACDDLKSTAPSLIVNGMGDAECASLQNDTGLNPSSGNNDCTDLNNLNDCLVGNMEQEVDAYDVCEWKPFMKRFIPNVWTVLKGIICAVCGLWANLTSILNQINDLWARLRALCDMIGYQSAPPVANYGSLVNNTTSPNYGGTIASKNGNPVFVKVTETIPPAYLGNVGVGIKYGKRQSTRCSDGACTVMEWLAPHFYGMRVNPDVELAWMDELWSVDKATVMGWGMTEATWNQLAIVPIAWSSDYIALATALFGVRMSIESNRLVLKYYGAIGSSNAAVSGKRIDNPRDGAEQIFQSTC